MELIKFLKFFSEGFSGFNELVVGYVCIVVFYVFIGGVFIVKVLVVIEYFFLIVWYVEWIFCVYWFFLGC